MSNPLAAISVATKTWILFALNLAITWFLLFCLKFPCKESDSNPSFSKFFANFFALCFVFTNTSVDPCFVFTCSTKVLYLSSCLKLMTSCFIVINVALAAATLTRSALFKYFLDSLSIEGAIVAENIKVCFCFGRNLIISSIWMLKPISNIRSISSKIKRSTLFNSKDFLFKWSFTLPGVPTTICGLVFNLLNCLFMGSPPTKQTLLITLC